ncbi:hypothetical protein M426DRAFT_316506 [Hypoxylon sp. CI-4A]|nr:hypothetical protein M426DRAFT_316506 [Hypoxylon sp. CI-4A]
MHNFCTNILNPTIWSGLPVFLFFTIFIQSVASLRGRLRAFVLENINIDELFDYRLPIYYYQNAGPSPDVPRAYRKARLLDVTLLQLYASSLTGVTTDFFPL